MKKSCKDRPKSIIRVDVWKRTVQGPCALYRPCTGSSGRPVAVSQSRYGFGPGTSLGPVPPPLGLPAVSPSPAPALSFASAACEKKGVIEQGKRKSHKLKQTKAVYISLKRPSTGQTFHFHISQSTTEKAFRLVPGLNLMTGFGAASSLHIRQPAIFSQGHLQTPLCLEETMAPQHLCWTLSHPEQRVEQQSG